MHLTDFLTRALRDNLAIIKNNCQEIHKDRYLISFTKHDYSHSERMLDLITRLITGSALSNGNKKLNEYESFILLSSIYLHDIGIQLYKDDVLARFAKEKKKSYDRNWSEEEKKKFVRDNHHLLSAFWIKDNLSKKPTLPTAYYGDKDLGTWICQVVISHGINFLTKDAYTRTVDYEGKEIRLKLLCELLCLADSLDCDKRRIDYEKLKTSETPDISMLHWMKHYYCNSVSTRHGQVRIAYKFPDSLDSAQQAVYSTYFKSTTKYWIEHCQKKYEEDLINYNLNFTISETEEYGDKDALDESLYIAIEDKLVDILLPSESLMSPKTVATGILVKGDKVVMVQRKHEEGSLKWQFPSGFLKDKQSPEERAVEEFENETGIKTRCIKRIGRRIHPDTRALTYYIALEYVSGELKNADINENAACEWVSVKDYQNLITTNIYGGTKRYIDETVSSEPVRKTDNKVVVGIVARGDEVLLVKRKPWVGELLWQFPGGSVEDGETAEEAVVRELKEETGVNAKVLTVIGERVHPYTKKHMSYIACEYLDGDLEVHDEDLEMAQWVKINELQTYFTTSFYDKVEDYLHTHTDTH